MAYDEESLFTGIRIGQTMKGWASFRAGGAGDSDVASHIYPKVAKLLVPSVLPVQQFLMPEIRAIGVYVPPVIPVENYEGSEG